jgi:hypothetical protein
MEDNTLGKRAVLRDFGAEEILRDLKEGGGITHRLCLGIKILMRAGLPRVLHKTAAKSTNYTEIFASLKSRKVSWYF